MENNALSSQQKNIVFIGFMGVGKTTIGKLVAEKLSRSFIDIDEEIEKEYSMTIPEIFGKYGEKVFREKEKELTLNLSNETSKVISIGGGAFTQTEIREICLANSIVYFIDMSWEYWKERIDILLDTRPVLQGKSHEEIQNLFYERQAIYTQHHFKYTTDGQSADEAADHIIESLELAWKQDESLSD